MTDERMDDQDGRTVTVSLTGAGFVAVFDDGVYSVAGNGASIELALFDLADAAGRLWAGEARARMAGAAGRIVSTMPERCPSTYSPSPDDPGPYRCGLQADHVHRTGSTHYALTTRSGPVGWY